MDLELEAMRYEDHNLGRIFEELYAVLYTSGSTGRPKGARLQQSSILNRITWQWETFPFRQRDVCVFKAIITIRNILPGLKNLGNQFVNGADMSFIIYDL